MGGNTLFTSDSRLKTDVVRVASRSGFGIYEFTYRNDPMHHRYRGVMAQEILQYRPDAVVLMDNGYYAVDYSKLDVVFEDIR